ncbi:zinc ribbon domain-containing protein YjdM [Leucobacter chromiireducens]|uniref:Alkylphosphonate utilization protein n=1 Tax=Leucobacter chromiireducens subsp. solipictus TaxID=398235 RepID=A0ABS1SEY2_9MICO|nr:zinc ribbon domain-containing protein YjdM [Leucobacter chromiireducens]MBL3679107.1 alkylphosphonate utilization protein [Leucobacter chromiireducens subsp. solipictus]
MTDSTADTAPAVDPDALPPCPACASEYAYESGALLVCPMCGHEWVAGGAADAEHEAEDDQIRDAVGNTLTDGDTVTLVKTVKVSGAGGGSIKVGTKVTGIRLVPGAADGHDIDARVPGFGKMKLKSSVVKRAG